MSSNHEETFDDDQIDGLENEYLEPVDESDELDDEPLTIASGGEDKSYLSRVCNHKVLKTEEERDLFRRYNEASSETAKTLLRNKIVESNMRMVAKIAMKHARTKDTGSLTEQDLIQEGFFGLNRAIEKFDLSRGLKFSTYATPWIRQSIQRAVEEKRTDIRTPRHAQNRMTSSRLALARAESAGNDEDIKKAKKDFEDAKGVINGMFFLEEMVCLDMSNDTEESDGRTMADMNRELQEFNTPDVILQQSRVEQVIREALESLPERDRKVLIARFGMNGDPEENLQEIANRMGVTRERIRQIQKGAQDMMKEKLLRSGHTSRHLI